MYLIDVCGNGHSATTSPIDPLQLAFVVSITFLEAATATPSSLVRTLGIWYWIRLFVGSGCVNVMQKDPRKTNFNQRPRDRETVTCTLISVQ